MASELTDMVEKFLESGAFDEFDSMLARQIWITEDDTNKILKYLHKIGKIEFGSTDREDVNMNIEAQRTDLVALVKPAPIIKGPRLPQPVLPPDLIPPFVKQLARYAGRLPDRRVRMNFYPLGARALAGTGMPMTSEAAPMRNRANGDNDEGSNEDNDEGLGRGGNPYPSQPSFYADRPNKDNEEGSNEDNDEGSGRGGNPFPSQPSFYADRPNKDNEEGSNKDNDEGSGRGGNGTWSRTLSRLGHAVIGGAVAFYLAYKTGQAIEGLPRDWKEAGFPPLVIIKNENVFLNFSIF